MAEPPDAKEVEWLGHAATRYFAEQLERLEEFKREREREAGVTMSDNDPLLATMRLVNLIAGQVELIERAMERVIAVEKAIGGEGLRLDPVPNGVRISRSSYRGDPRAAIVSGDSTKLYRRAYDLLAGLRCCEPGDDTYKPAFSERELQLLKQRLV